MATATSIDLQKFRFILSSFLSADNDARSKAEVEYDSMHGSEKFCLALSAVSDDSVPNEEAELAAVLLRRLITAEFDQICSKLGPIVQNEAKSQILLRLQQDVNPNLKRKISDVAAELARKCIDEEGNNRWPDFLKYLFDSARSPDPVLREIALLMFSSVPGVFGNQQSRYIDVIHQMLIQSLADQQSEKVRYTAVKATSSFILANEKEFNVIKQFTDCLTLLLQFFGQVLDSQDGEPDEILRYLVDLVEACPQFFRSHLEILLVLCMKAVSNPEYQDSCRHLSLEVIVTLCESAPSMVKKLGNQHIPTILTLILKMMTDIEEVDNWEFFDDEDLEEDNDSTPVVAEASLDRIACALGGKVILPLILSLLPQMLNSPEWKERYAGLMAISAIGEGCHKQMTTFLGQIVDGVLPFLNDQHKRVRYAACNAMGQMSSDFAPIFQKKFHEKVIPALLQLMTDAFAPKVQAHAGAALVNFFEDCPKQILIPHLEGIIKTLESVLTTTLKDLVGKGKKLVLEQVVVTLASLADSAQEKFIEHYDRFIPFLKYIIQNADQPDLRLLRGKTIECVSLIGLAVGREKFLVDASQIMDLLLKAQASDAPMADDDPQLSYMIAAWARICKILGKEFKPYLPFVMEPVLKAAAIKPEIALLDTDDMKVIGNDDDWEFVNLGDKPSFGIRTAGLDEKATACQMLVCYAKELKEAFSEYVEDTLKLMVPMLKFYFHDGVRIAAAEILPALLESAKVRGDAYVQEMWRFILPALLQAVDSEPECEVLCEHMAAFAQCLAVLNCPCLQTEELSSLINILNKNLVGHFERYDAREEKKKEEDYDEVIEETLIKEDDEDVYLLSKVSEILSNLFTIYKQDFFVYFDMLLPHYVHLLEPSRPWPDRQWGLCVFADIIESTGPACSRYKEYFMQPIITSLSDESVDLRQTSSYVLGVIGQFGGTEFGKFCSDSLPFLMQMINEPNSRSEENERATENAISAVTKFLAFQSEVINTEDLIPIWVTWLPVWEDEEEVQCIYNFLCVLLETNHPSLMGSNNSVLPKIVQIVAESFLKEAVDIKSDIGRRFVILIREIQNNEELFSICINHLNQEQQKALFKALDAQRLLAATEAAK